MHQRLALASFLLFAAAISAQAQSTYNENGQLNDLAVQLFAEPSLPEPPAWTPLTTSNDNYAALQYSSAGANAVTLILAFVVPDPDYQPNVNVLATLRTLYPFIDHPQAYWTAYDDVLRNLNVAFENGSSASVVIPPVRIAAAVTAALSAPESFGPMGATPPALYARPAVGTGSWPSSVEVTDERHVLSGWWNATHTIVRIDQLGRRALEVAAFQWSSQVQGEAVAEFDAMIRQTYQWAIHLQAVEITPPTPTHERPRLRLSNPVKVHRRSQGALEEDPWLAVMGPSRATVYLPMAGQRFYIAGRNELAFFDLADGSVGADCQAYMPILGGGWAIQPRLTTFGSLDLLHLQPTIAVFACPGNAVHGNVFFSKADLTQLLPAFPAAGSAGAAAMWVFSPQVPLQPPE
jgi:hypothetical protein